MSKWLRFKSAVCDVNKYSQIGFRGVPWHSVIPKLEITNGNPVKNSRTSDESASTVHAAAAAAEGLKLSIEISPSATASWLPLTIERFGNDRRSLTTSFGCAP